MSVVDSNNLINLVAYKLLSKCRELKTNENVIISPFSISLGLTSLAFGAKGKSRSDIATLLEVRSDCVTDEDLRALSSAFKDPGEGIKLANGLFADKTYPISESYCQILKKSLLPLESKPVDFVNQSVATLKEINKWVEAATNSMIKDFFTSDSIDVDTRLVLVNAIHFKGIWEEAFDESATVKKPFHLSPSEEVAVDMMNVEKYFNFSQSPQLDCDCIELPYKQSSVSCYIFLPNKIDGLKVIDDNLSPALFKEIIERVSGNKRKISLSLPKFQIECEVDLKEVLTALGVVDIFQDGVADLSGFSEGGRALFVSKAIHKAVIEVNEEGTEAAAATGFAAVCYMSYICPDEFLVDHPFALVIFNKKSNTVLFMGSIKQINQ